MPFESQSSYFTLKIQIKGYCGLNANVEILSPSVMGSGSRVCGRCRGHKGGALMNGMSAFIKETRGSSVTLSAGEDTVRSVCESGRSQVLTRHQICCHLTLDFPGLQNCEK